MHHARTVRCEEEGEIYGLHERGGLECHALPQAPYELMQRWNNKALQTVQVLVLPVLDPCHRQLAGH